MSMTFSVEVEREQDGRFLAEVVSARQSGRTAWRVRKLCLCLGWAKLRFASGTAWLCPTTAAAWLPHSTTSGPAATPRRSTANQLHPGDALPLLGGVGDDIHELHGDGRQQLKTARGPTDRN